MIRVARAPLLWTGTIMLVSGCRSSVPLGRLDAHDISGYMARLGRSDSAEAKDIRARLKSAASDLARERAESGKEGIPLNAAALSGPTVPPSENAAPLYAELDRPYRLLKRSWSQRMLDQGMGPQYAYSAVQLAEARKELEAHRRIIDVIRLITARPRCDFRRNWSFGISVMFPEFAHMRNATLLLVSESYLLALDGKYEQSVAEMQRGFRLATHAGSDHVLMAYLTENTIEGMTLRGLEDLLKMAGPDAKVAAAVRKAIVDYRPRHDLVQSLRWEPAITEITLSQMRQKPEQQLESFLGSDSGKSGGTKPALSAEERRFVDDLWDAVDAECLARYRKVFAALRLPLAERRTQLAKILPPSSDKASDNPINALAQMLMVFGPANLDSAILLDARAAADITAADVLSWKAKNGSWPNGLDQLPGNPQSDPFTGKPLKYHKEPHGFVVYSVGPAGRFDGGKPGTKSEPRQAYFRYPGEPPMPYIPND